MGRRYSKQALIILLVRVIGPFAAIGIAYLIAPFIK